MTGRFVPDNATPAPSVVAAQLTLGALDIDRVPWWAAQWLSEGIDGPALRELAGLGTRDQAVYDLLPAAMAEMAIDLPTGQVAAAVVIFNDLAAMCLVGRADERWVAAKVEEVVVNSDYAPEVVALPLGKIWNAPDYWGGEWLPELRELIRKACQHQLHLDGPNHGS
ncbi:hypothetical protein HDA40_002665 [Hamadaea flava]|uniref:Uncharacterized protein n=1 Tax=Hamadaea flava TaxID=1742688 RepID=A0ABV8LL49_9ACTN|nr:hypothetical protein [Hamadaea flava]MCP2324158.1 hypothetical protein [Hamadaea flava]